MIDIQHGSLRALKQQALALSPCLVKLARDISDHWSNLLALGKRLIQYLLEINLVHLVIVLKGKVMIIQYLTQARLEVAWIKQLSQPDATAGNLILIGRADTPPSGANGLFATGRFTGLIQGDMVRQDKRAALTDTQTLPGRHTTPFQHLYLLQ